MIEFIHLDQPSYESWSYQIIKQDQAHFPKPWSQKAWEEVMTHFGKYQVFIACGNGYLLAYALYKLGFNEYLAHLLKIQTAPDQRRSFIAERLLSFSFYELGKNHQMDRVFLDVAVSNTAAIKLYEKLGFRHIQRRRKYYSTGEDAFSMDLCI